MSKPDTLPHLCFEAMKTLYFPRENIFQEESCYKYQQIKFLLKAPKLALLTGETKSQEILMCLKCATAILLISK